MHISSPRAPAPCILSLDIGSTSVRARLYDAEARPVPNAGHEIRRRPQPDGEEDAEQIRELCEETITKALEAAGATDPAAGHIDAVAVAMFVGNVLGIDAKGNAATPLYTYAHAGARSEVEELRSRLDPELTYDRTGTPFHTSYQAPRILWVKNNEPDLYSKTARWIDLGTYLYSKWFDSLDVPSSYSAASWSGMLDRAKPAWYGPILDAIGISLDALPRLADYSSAMQGLAPHWAARWPALANVPFYLAVGDGAGANIGSGCGASGSVALTIGTTGAMRAIVKAGSPTVPRGLWSYRVDAGHELLGGAITDGGSLLDWLHSTLRLDGERIRNEDIAAVEPDSHGLTVLPFLRGERSPGWATEATATWHGVRASTTAPEMARAALEAVTYRLALISELLDDGRPRTNEEPTEIIAGGAAILNLPAWLQMVADITGKRVVTSPDRGTTARGVTIMALKALGVLDSLHAIPAARNDTYEPDPALNDLYQNARRRHGDLYDILI
ncbi:MAG: gluconokinase [Chloroflexi bacterium]|nr:gluconokinase [Chloroflexota bacterium]